MTEKSPVYVGVEIIRSAGRLHRAFVFAALDEDLSLLALCHGDREEVLAYLGGQQTAFAAINAPRSPNTGIVNDKSAYQNSLPFDESDPPVNARLCEILLQGEGFKIGSTPDKVKSCSLWMRRGFDLYRRLAAFDYLPYPGQDSPRHSLEICADAIFWRLLSHKLPLPNSLEGRLQRQLILYEQEVPVPDAMDFFMEITRYKLIQGDLPDEDIYSFEELNALAAAFIAWKAAHQPDQIEHLGDADEGQITLPILTS